MSRWPAPATGRQGVALPQAYPATPTTSELVSELGRLSHGLDAILIDYRGAIARHAVAEDGYRMARATAHVGAKEALIAQGIKSPTVDDCRAYVDLLTSRERIEAHTAEGYRDACKEALRSRQAQLSALQSVAAAVRSEAELAGKGPA